MLRDALGRDSVIPRNVRSGVCAASRCLINAGGTPSRDAYSSIQSRSITSCRSRSAPLASSTRSRSAGCLRLSDAPGRRVEPERIRRPDRRVRDDRCGHAHLLVLVDRVPGHEVVGELDDLDPGAGPGPARPVGHPLVPDAGVVVVRERSLESLQRAASPVPVRRTRRRPFIVESGSRHPAADRYIGTRDCM